MKRLFVLLSSFCLMGCGTHHVASLVTVDAVTPTPAPLVALAGRSSFSSESAPSASGTTAIASGTAPTASGTAQTASDTAPVASQTAEVASGTPDASSTADLPPLPPDTGTPPEYPWPGDRATCERTLTLQEAKLIDPAMTTSAFLVIQDLLAIGVQHVDIWYGSHIVIKGDQGAYYERWTAEPQQIMQRASSHTSKVQQYQIAVGFRDNGILMGETPDGDTWVQLERHAYHSSSTSTIGKVIGFISNITSAHNQDFFIYHATHQNVGPLGLSPYTDSNPLVIDAPGTTGASSPS
ncbi:MAG TPA: hypothetical protein V6D47_14690 [Oscillatoriaceae cyanobacterium]